ncbi:cytochrome oxidase assembly protein ShyY1 [Brevibacterium sanguinis]|uniref:SURF1-like protein n=2 Tax=Brevibacterium TaxID=1696 RepID=A0A366IIR7_9MICO|nr:MULTISPECIES: SURF1 family protein [Brevibacterium]RBP64646.1 cytochrome oxidase assembly protein ShyY1 [Brevibacterium sanguinis]RBP71711.1 cytochrome oxidase assembly protein ShyY1 [Brevibacterium celere]
MARYSFLLSARWLKYMAMTVIVVIACVVLALWQKDRQEQRSAEIATIEANYSAEPVDVEELLDSTSATLDPGDEWRPVALTGEYRAEDTVLARNRTVNDRTGFYVVVPFRLETGETIALVRGWIPDAEAVPAAPSGVQTVTARLRPAQDGSDDRNPEGMIRAIDPERIPGMDEGYAQVYGEVALDDVRPDGTDGQGLTALPEPDRNPGNHLSYMLQWFTFGVMIIIAVAISARRERAAAAEASQGPAGEVEYVVVDKAALAAGAKIRPGSRYGRHRLGAPVVHGRDEADEDALLDDRFR